MTNRLTPVLVSVCDSSPDSGGRAGFSSLGPGSARQCSVPVAAVSAICLLE